MSPPPSAKGPRADRARLASSAALVDRVHRPNVTPARSRMGRHSSRSRLAKIPRDFGERPGIGAPRLRGKRGSSARCSASIAFRKAAELARLVVQRHQEPAPVAAAIVVGERARRLLAAAGARHARRTAGSARSSRWPTGRSAGARSGRRRPARPLAAIERRHDGGIERRRRRMVAHARHRARRLDLRGRCPHHVHQAGARPVGGGVEAGPRRLLARPRRRPRSRRRSARGFSASRSAAAIFRRSRTGTGKLVTKTSGRSEQAVQHREPFGMLEIDRQAALVCAP